MPHILKNEQLEVHIDLPNENYQTSRFDWTGKIQTVLFNNIPLTITEKNDDRNEHYFGKGFYNEFGIDNALGFKEAEIGEWFHKIGIGLLKKNESEYFFHKEFEIDPATFTVEASSDSITTTCTSSRFNGYAYILTKEIRILESGFNISYQLKNIGKKNIRTDEYVHNFLAINHLPINNKYEVRFPFLLKSNEFGDVIDTEQRIELHKNNLLFNETPVEQLFISHLAGKEPAKAEWELIHSAEKIGIRELGSFPAQKVNLWGWNHVVSPELFHHIHLAPDESTEWSRTYEIFNTD